MNKVLEDLIKISNITGKDTSLVQGGGGNTSAKTDDSKYMYIKASGTALKDMNAKIGWRRMRLESALSVIKSKELAGMDVNKREVEVVNQLLLACDDDVSGDARPSVEAHLHAIMDKYVIHLHPIAVGAYVNAKDGKSRIEKLFKDEKFPPLWVEYTDPGFMLAKKIAKLVGDYEIEYRRKPAVLFLEKHGLFVTSNDADKGLRLVRKVIRLCNSKLKTPKAIKPKALSKNIVNDIKLSIRRAIFNATGKYLNINYFMDKEISGWANSKNTATLLAGGVLTPDELVYGNGAAVWIEKPKADVIEKKLKAQLAKGAKPALSFMVRGAGLFVAGGQAIAAVIKDIVAGSLFVRSNAAKMGGINSLNKRQQDFINNWESEAFRKAMVASGAASELNGRIAVVTGAGSGLGRSIAIGLARAGAQVVVADIDIKAAKETVASIKKELSKAVAISLNCNVTSEDSVNKGFEELVEKWGGLDILVNAAGVAPAYPLIDMPVDKWRFALEVNLTGYFLMAKAAAGIMIEQGIGGSIINLSSKSGLEASKNNSAYNATKAGELHLARGWAMELGKSGIRVNSVCPGNVFEGSKIWNPAYIKTCAKKYGIKPEEVIDHYVSKTILGLEIKGQDIADAIVFLASDRSRRMTGQTLVVDAGQVMVR